MTLNRKISPQINNIEQISFLKPEHFQLSNGLDVYSINSGFQDLTRIEIIFDAGSWYSNKALVASVTASMFNEGTKSKNSQQIAELIDSNGAYLEVNVDKDFSTVSLFCLNKYLNKMLPLMSEMLLKPTFPQEELDILLNNRKQSYLVNNQKVGFIARNKFLAMIVGKDHPYGRYNEEKDYSELKRNDLLDFYEKNYSFDNARIIVSGKIESNLIDKLEKEFGSIKIQKSNIIEKIIHEEQPFHEHLQTIEVSSAVQNALRIGLKTIDKNHSDFHGLKVVNTIFGGYFGSRLMTNIREDKGYTYGIGSGIAAHKNASFFFISSEIKSENSQDAIKEILHELEVLQTKKIETEELMLVKNYIQGVFQRSFDGTFAQADRFKDLLLWNLDYNYYTEFIEKVKNIDESEIRRIASTYLKSESLFSLVVGKIN